MERKLTPRERLIRISALLKEGKKVNSRLFNDYLNALHCRKVSAKTLQRDVGELRKRYGAGIEWNEHEQVYRLPDPNWCLPLLDLIADDQERALFTSMFCTGLAAPYLAGNLRAGVNQITNIEVAVGLPGGISKGLLESIVLATTARPALKEDVFDAVSEGWRRSLCLDLDYENADGKCARRIAEPHVLYLSNGAWYIHAWCRTAKGWRNFALHRINGVRLLEKEEFKRKPEVVDRVRSGNVFQFPEVEGVRLRASPVIAKRIREREWFSGQAIMEAGDGAVIVSYARVTKPFLLHWVMAYEGELVILEPPSLRQELLDLCDRLAARHRAAGLNAQAGAATATSG